MADPSKVQEFIGKLRQFIGVLEQHHTIAVHQQINQFYYMQKAEELSMLSEQLKNVTEKQSQLSALIDRIYPEAVLQWEKDLHWFSLNVQEILRKPEV